MNAVAELFGHPSDDRAADWKSIVAEQQCPFLGRRCYKVRKSDPQTSIGSCTVLHGKERAPILICPARLLERRQVFTDCLHLLTDDAMHFHAYEVEVQADSSNRFSLRERLSTDAEGIAVGLGLRDDPRIDLSEIHEALKSKIGPTTLFNPA